MPSTSRLLMLAVPAAALLALGACRSANPPTGTIEMADQHSVAAATTTTRANPQMREILQALAALNPKPIANLSAAEARRQPTMTDAVKSVQRKRGIISPPLGLARVEDRTIPGPDDGTIPIRIYVPGGKGPFPVVVYYHGGGFVLADLDTYDASARGLAYRANAIVVSADYRKGPEHKFPAAHQDAFAAYQWTLANAKALGGDPMKVAVVGESAGGNLAANVAIMARDMGIRQPVHEVLVYPVAGADMDTTSYLENANAVPLNKAMMNWFFNNYLTVRTEMTDPRIDLVNARLAGLPTTTIIAAEIDPLRSDSEILAERLQAAGVPVELRIYKGVTHEFFGADVVLNDAKDAQELAAARLRHSFGTDILGQ